MRLLAATIILMYGGLVLFGLGMLPHGEHDICPFSGQSGDCAIIGSLASTLNHLEAFRGSFLALPIFFSIFLAAILINWVGRVVPSFALHNACFCTQDSALTPRKTFYRWFALLSSYS